MPRCDGCGGRGPSEAHERCGAPAPLAVDDAIVELEVPGYRAARLIGRGGFGSVFAAEREGDGIVVAVKVATPGSIVAAEQLAREAEALRAVGAPAVPALHDQGTRADGAPYLVLEHVADPTLGDVLDRACGPLAPAEFGGAASAFLWSLREMHARGYAHLDLKPENAFAAPDRVRLFDLGLSRRMGSPWLASQFAGTPAYMSPEQWEARGEVDPRADVYAAGVVLFEMLTGRVPFSGARGEVQAAHLGLRPPRPSTLADVPPALDEVVLKALSKDPDRRFPTVAVLADAVGAAIRAAGPPAAPVARPVAAPPEGSQEKQIFGVLFVSGAPDANALRPALTAFGGQLAVLSPGRCAAVFDAQAADNPVRRAARAAHALLERKLAPRAIVDLCTVLVHRRPDSPPRFLSAAFSKASSYPLETDPRAVLVADAAAPLLGDADLQPAREGFRKLAPPAQHGDATVLELGAGDLVGRADVFDRLRAAAGEAIAGSQPGVVTVIAEPGHGKSRLCAALLEDLRSRRGVQVIEQRAAEPVAGDVDGTFRALLARALDLPTRSGGGPARELRARLAVALGPALAAELWPAVALVFGVLDAQDPALRSLGAAPGALRSMAVRAAGEGLRRLAAKAPLCVVLDDAQFADDAALDALEYAALAEASVPLWVCVLGRPQLATARPSLGERAARAETIHLGPLDAKAAADLCRKLLEPAENTPAAAIDRLVQRTQGIPLLLVELVRGLKRDGLVRRRLGGDTWYLATDELDRLPDLPLIEWVAQRELSALPADLAAHARLAALLGAEFAPDELEAVLAELEKRTGASDFPLDARVATRRLQSGGLLVASRQGLLRFRHALVRDAVARSIAAAQREHIHAAATAFYRRATWISERRRLPLLAFHSAHCGQRAQAAALYLSLAEGARVRHAYLEAERTYTAALELIDASAAADRLLAFRGRGSMRYRIGRTEDSLADLAQARALARTADDVKSEIDILLDEATALDWTNDYARSAARVAEARELASTPGVFRGLVAARIELGLGRALFRENRHRDALAHLEEAVRLSEGVGDEGYETLLIAFILLEVLLPLLGRSEEAEKVAARALSLCDGRGDLLHRSAVINNRRNLLIARKDVASAIADQEAFMRIGRELGVLTNEYFAEINLGELRYYSGDLDAAQMHAQHAMRIETRHPDTAPRPVGALLLARVHAVAGRIASARAVLDDVRASVARAKEAGRQSAELARSEEVLAAAVDLATRDSSAAEWAELRRRSATDSIEQEPIEVVELHALTALRLGRVHESLAAFADALAVARRIPNIVEPRLLRERERAERA